MLPHACLSQPNNIGDVVFSFIGTRQSGLKQGDRVVVSTSNVNAPSGSALDGTTVQHYAGTVQSVTNATDAVTLRVAFDDDIDNLSGTDGRFAVSVFLTASSRPRRVINQTRSIAVMTPSWGFRNDTAHGPHAPINTIQTNVREGTYVVGSNDTDRKTAVMQDAVQGIPSVEGVMSTVSRAHTPLV